MLPLTRRRPVKFNAQAYISFCKNAISPLAITNRRRNSVVLMMSSTKADEKRRGLPSIRAWQVEFTRLEVAGGGIETMAKRETAEKSLRKMVTDKSADIQRTSIIERRTALPQPDFSHYRKKNSYPGESFFFVGHSYNVEQSNGGGKFAQQRKSAIKLVLKKASKTNTVSVKDALQQKEFVSVLSRVERDWLGRLPEGALIGPAIGKDGAEIDECFTVWRKEQRRLATVPAGKKPAAAVKTSAKTVAKPAVKKAAAKPTATVATKSAAKAAKPVAKKAVTKKTTVKPAAKATAKKAAKPAARAKAKPAAAKAKAKTGARK
jgi:hypothetical protein